MLRILVGDDHPMFRRGTHDVLLEGLSPVHIEEAPTGTEVLELVKRQTWDVCIMDVSMPGKSGTDLLQEILGLRPSMPVLVFSMHPEQMYAVRMIRSGAKGYLNKATTTPASLIEAVRSVTAGRKFVTPSVAECLANTVQMRTPSIETPEQLLSNRELQIYEMLVAGRQIKEIATHLCVSPVTISTYRARISEKLGLKSNADLIRYAIENSLFA
jgi:two-component system invasion response regulator UvrY